MSFYTKAKTNFAGLISNIFRPDLSTGTPEQCDVGFPSSSDDVVIDSVPPKLVNANGEEIFEDIFDPDFLEAKVMSLGQKINDYGVKAFIKSDYLPRELNASSIAGKGSLPDRMQIDLEDIAYAGSRRLMELSEKPNRGFALSRMSDGEISRLLGMSTEHAMFPVMFKLNGVRFCVRISTNFTR